MSDKKNLILSGFMGTGKSSVGKSVSEVLGFEFVDTDNLIENRCGKTIAKIFSEDGEKYFRELEKETLIGLPEHKIVIAAGGGIIIDQDNYNRLSGLGLIIILTASVESICRRIRNDKSRPLLSGENLNEKVRELLSQRRHVYDRISYKINTDRLSVADTCDAVIRMYRKNT
ncbi:MAG: shikimate kinase [candidate division Zixibacteria bacterium]